VGRIGSSDLTDFTTGFFVGSNFNEVATETGRLFLGYNDGFVRPDRSGLDSGAVGDNSGSFIAEIAIAPGAQPPVILVHGWCGSRESFGMMGQFLLEDLNVPKVGTFNYDDTSSIPDSERGDIQQLASRLAQYISDQMAELGVGEVDVVAHSMGGLIARAWMVGMTDVPYANQIRRLVLAGTPNFGVGLIDLGKIGNLLGETFLCDEDVSAVRKRQNQQMLFGSQFLEELNEKWNREVGQSVFPPNILTIVGCGGLLSFGGECLGDLVVQAESATLPPESPDYLVRYVDRKHFGSLIEIEEDDREHETYQLISQFLRTGTAGSFFTPSFFTGWLIVPLKDPSTHGPFSKTSGVEFGQNTQTGRRLPHCEDISLSSPFTAIPPANPAKGFGPSGLWTLTGVIEGCWVLQVESRKYISEEEEITIMSGRPMLLDPVKIFSQSDPSPPIGSVGINGGASSTNSSLVTLNLSANDNIAVTGYYVSSTSADPPAAKALGWSPVSPAMTFSGDVAYILIFVAGDGARVVNVWYKDKIGNVSDTASASIIIDQSPPETTITGGPTGTITTRSVTFMWTGADTLTPTAGLVYAWYLEPVQSTYSPFSATTSRLYTNLPNGNYTFFVKAKDQAGNEDPTPRSQTFTVQVSGGGGGGWSEEPPE